LRYIHVFKKIESLFLANVYNKDFAKKLFDKVDFKLLKKTRIPFFKEVSKSNRF
jgi:hypothetical protein